MVLVVSKVVVDNASDWDRVGLECLDERIIERKVKMLDLEVAKVATGHPKVRKVVLETW